MVAAPMTPRRRNPGIPDAGRAFLESHDESLSDLALIAAVAAGDVSALDALYARYRSPAFACAYSLLRERNAAEDALHDAFLNVWRGAAAFQPARGSLRGWLLTIVRNAAIDHLRGRRQASYFAFTPEEPLQPGPAADDPAAEVAGALEAQRLRGAVAGLPASQRHAVELAFFAGLTHGEIAARTGVPLGTVKGRVRLGLRRLRHDLRELAPETTNDRAA